MSKEINLILGKTGSGKSWYSLYKAAESALIYGKKVSYISFEHTPLSLPSYIIQRLNGIFYYLYNTEPNLRSFSHYFKWYQKNQSHEFDTAAIPLELRNNLGFLFIPEMVSDYYPLSRVDRPLDLGGGYYPVYKQQKKRLEDAVSKVKLEALFLDDLGLVSSDVRIRPLFIFAEIGKALNVSEIYYTHPINRNGVLNSPDPYLTVFSEFPNSKVTLLDRDSKGDIVCKTLDKDGNTYA